MLNKKYYGIKMKILFVCYGNVSRSQIAEAYYNHLTKTNDAKSAGVAENAGMKYHHPAQEIIRVMLEENIDISKNIVKAATKEMVDEADKIIVMCDRDDCPRFMTDSVKTEYAPFSDPYGLGIEYARSVREDIKKMVLELIK